MKDRRFLLMVSVVVGVLMVVLIGCKYDVTDSPWNQLTPVVAPTPTITDVIPSAAVAGVNTITIQGQGFGDSLVDMSVFFDNTQTEILNLSTTSITVRRPNLVSTNAVIKVSYSKAYAPMKKSPYVLDRVLEKAGNFAMGTKLGAVTVDSVENVYVVSSDAPYNIFEITPSEIQTTYSAPTFIKSSSTRASSDAKVHNGKLYLMGAGSKLLAAMSSIQIWDPTTNQITDAFKMPGMNYGDFDAYGNFYAGGNTTDLCVVPPNPPASPTITKAGVYSKDSIFCVRVYNGNLYIASRIPSSGTPIKIWKHSIDSLGNLGPQDLVLDLASTNFASRLVRAITFSSTGLMYIVTEKANALLVFDPSSGKIDYFYKEIISHTFKNATSYWFGKQACWGNGNNLYMIANDTTSDAANTANKWNVLKVMMGTAGTPYY